MIPLLHLTRFGDWLGASEARTEPYINTAREYWRLQQRQAAKSNGGVSGSAGKQAIAAGRFE